MTKGEARRLFLRYLGEATVNGRDKNDPDLIAAFDDLFCAAIVQVGASYPNAEYVKTDGRWTAPPDMVEVRRMLSSRGTPVYYTYRGNRLFTFSEPCTVEYMRAPHMPDAALGDDAVIDLDERVCQLVPLQAAVNAAISMPEYEYMVPYITAELNAFSATLDERSAPVYRQVYAV